MTTFKNEKNDAEQQQWQQRWGGDNEDDNNGNTDDDDNQDSRNATIKQQSATFCQNPSIYAAICQKSLRNLHQKQFRSYAINEQYQYAVAEHEETYPTGN